MSQELSFSERLRAALTAITAPVVIRETVIPVSRYYSIPLEIGPSMPYNTRFEVYDPALPDPIKVYSLGCMYRDGVREVKNSLMKRYPPGKYELYLVVPSKLNNQ